MLKNISACTAFIILFTCTSCSKSQQKAVGTIACVSAGTLLGATVGGITVLGLMCGPCSSPTFVVSAGLLGASVGGIGGGKTGSKFARWAEGTKRIKGSPTSLRQKSTKSF